MIDPYRFPNYWQYCNKYCVVENTPYGKKITGINEERLEEWKEVMTPYILQRFKNDYIEDLPEKIYKKLYVPMHAKHRKIYEEYKQNSLAGS
jgi:SNF2 family DNA or RNA helicase